MLTHKYISGEAIVDAMFSQYGFNPQDIHELDIYEYIFSAMRLMGVPSAMINKIAVIDIVDHRGELPCDLNDIEDGGVREHFTRETLNYSDDIYYQLGEEGRLISPNELPELNPVPVSIEGKTHTIVDFDPRTPGYVPNVPLLEMRMTYKLEGFNQIMVGFETGKIDVSYKAFPSTRNGDKVVPEVPDNERYIAGVKGHCAWMIGQFLWMKDKLSDKKLEYLAKERDWYIGSGSNAGRLPSKDQMEVIKNNQITLVQDLFQHRTGFNRLGLSRQRRRRW
jgi:hypothetical protein